MQTVFIIGAFLIALIGLINTVKGKSRKKSMTSVSLLVIGTIALISIITFQILN